MITYCKIKNLITGRFLCNSNFETLIFSSEESAYAYMANRNLKAGNFEIMFLMKRIEMPEWIR